MFDPERACTSGVSSSRAPQNNIYAPYEENTVEMEAGRLGKLKEAVGG